VPVGHGFEDPGVQHCTFRRLWHVCGLQEVSHHGCLPNYPPNRDEDPMDAAGIIIGQGSSRTSRWALCSSHFAQLELLHPRQMSVRGLLLRVTSPSLFTM
jgi:hypothetical protein